MSTERCRWLANYGLLWALAKLWNVERLRGKILMRCNRNICKWKFVKYYNISLKLFRHLLWSFILFRSTFERDIFCLMFFCKTKIIFKVSSDVNYMFCFLREWREIRVKRFKDFLTLIDLCTNALYSNLGNGTNDTCIYPLCMQFKLQLVVINFRSPLCHYLSCVFDICNCLLKLRIKTAYRNKNIRSKNQHIIKRYFYTHLYIYRQFEFLHQFSNYFSEPTDR